MSEEYRANPFASLEDRIVAIVNEYGCVFEAEVRAVICLQDKVREIDLWSEIHAALYAAKNAGRIAKTGYGRYDRAPVRG